MSLPANVISLRALLAGRFPEAHAARQKGTEITTGIEWLDAAGWVAGSVLEVVGETPGAGVGLLLAALLEGKGLEVRQPLALVDGADAFDPISLSPVALERLLWVRCREPEQAVKATDLLLRDGNLPRIFLDLQLHSLRTVRRIPAQAWHRLRMLAEKNGVSLCVLTPGPLIPCVTVRILMEEKFNLEVLDAARETLVKQLHGRILRGDMKVPNLPSERLAG